MWDEIEYYFGDPVDYSHDIMADCGFLNKSYEDFWGQLIENTRLHKLIWNPVFDKNLMWDKVNGEYCGCTPVIRCKVGRRYLYAELDDGIYDVDSDKNIKSISGLYSICNNEKKYYLLSEYPYVDYHEGLEFIVEQCDDLLLLYKTIEKVNEDFFRLFERERAIRRINLLNSFYDLIVQQSEECDIEMRDKQCFYKNYFLSCNQYGRICVLQRNKNGYSIFEVYDKELDKMMKDAYGDITYYEHDVRFKRLLSNWYFLR